MFRFSRKSFTRVVLTLLLCFVFGGTGKVCLDCNNTALAAQSAQDDASGNDGNDSTGGTGCACQCHTVVVWASGLTMERFYQTGLHGICDFDEAPPSGALSEIDRPPILS